MVEHGPGHAIEEFIQAGEELISRHRLCQRGGTAQVAEPDHRANVFPVTAPDQAVEHAFARMRTEVGIEQTRGLALQCVNFVNSTQYCEYFVNMAQVGGSETPRSV